MQRRRREEIGDVKEDVDENVGNDDYNALTTNTTTTAAASAAYYYDDENILHAICMYRMDRINQQRTDISTSLENKGFQWLRAMAKLNDIRTISEAAISNVHTSLHSRLYNT